MNRMTKKRVGMVLAFSLTLTGAAAYIGIQQGNTDKTEAAGSLTASVSASLNASEVEALDVTKIRRQKKQFRKIPRRIPASVGIKILESRRCREA